MDCVCEISGGNYCSKCGKSIRGRPTSSTTKLHSVKHIYEAREIKKRCQRTSKKDAVMALAESELNALRRQQKISLKKLQQIRCANESSLKNSSTLEPPRIVSVDVDYLNTMESVCDLYPRLIESQTTPHGHGTVRPRTPHTVPPLHTDATESTTDAGHVSDDAKAWFWGVDVRESLSRNAKRDAEHSVALGHFWGHQMSPLPTYPLIELTVSEKKLLTDVSLDNTTQSNGELNSRHIQETLQDSLLGYSRTTRVIRNAILDIRQAVSTADIDVSRDYYLTSTRPLFTLRSKSEAIQRAVSGAEELVEVVNASIDALYRKCLELRATTGVRVCDILNRIGIREEDSFEDAAALTGEGTAALQAELLREKGVALTIEKQQTLARESFEYWTPRFQAALQGARHCVRRLEVLYRMCAVRVIQSAARQYLAQINSWS